MPEGHECDAPHNADVRFKNSAAEKADFVNRVPVERATAVDEIGEIDFVLQVWRR